MKKKPLPKNSENRVILEPKKHNFSFVDEIKVKGLENIIKSYDTRNAIVKDISNSRLDLYKLESQNDPTQIPYVTTTFGNFLINPSTVNIATLQKIASHEIVSKCIHMHIATITSKLGKVLHHDKEIQAFLRDEYDRIENGQGIQQSMEKILTKMIYGFSINYKREYVQQNGKYRGFRRISKLDLLPPSSVLFSADAEGNTDNIYQYVYSYPLSNMANMYSMVAGGVFGLAVDNVAPLESDMNKWSSYGDADYPQRTNVINTMGLILLDKRYCIHSIFDNIIKVQNPYGYCPLTRRVYDLIQIYDLIKGLHENFLGYRACPLLVGYAKGYATSDAPDGSVVTKMQGLYDAMSKVNYTGSIILDGLKGENYHIEALESNGDREAFTGALQIYRDLIQQTLLFPNGLFESEASYASATTQGGSYDKLMGNQLNKLTKILKYHINKPLIEANFGNNVDDYGSFSTEMSSLDDKLKLAKLYEMRANMGGYSALIKSDNDLERLSYGLEPYSEQEFKEFVKYKEQELLKSNNKLNSKAMYDTSDKTNANETKDAYSNKEIGHV